MTNLAVTITHETDQNDFVAQSRLVFDTTKRWTERAKLLRAARLHPKCDVAVETVALEAGINVIHYRVIENGVLVPDMETLKRIARAIGIIS